MADDPAGAVQDPARLAELRESELMDSEPEEAFDRLTRLAAKLLDAPMAMVSLVGSDRQFFKSQAGGIDGLGASRETTLDYSYCRHVVADHAPLVLVDARKHPLLADHLAARELGVIAYLGVPLVTTTNHALGSLCVVDTEPRQWSEDAIATLQTLGESVMAEIELRLLAKKLHGNLLRLRASELERGELVDMLVHDLRNPLTSLLGGLDMMALSPILPADLREDLELSRDGGRTLLQMVNDILDVGRANAGRLRLDRTTFPARVLLEDVRDQLAHLARAAGVSLVLETSPPELELTADRELLRRVLVNLAANAVQHSPRESSVRLAAHAGPSAAVHLEVSDSGAGIGEAALKQLFEKYGPATGVKGRISTGLGLPFCKMVVEAHDGSIGVESVVGHGSVFRLTLPAGAAT